ncbi:hypothetical protein CEXT_191281 [Caerostris extrusa]|uniref:Ribosomal protein S14 n=1 Tax=Caerostris extrusa TaxID=172846 RepID=A0AAV4WKW3_CAEEX|nr:hypothetical protein CEXT_191281 [Caerostris extrusa]
MEKKKFRKFQKEKEKDYHLSRITAGSLSIETVGVSCFHNSCPKRSKLYNGRPRNSCHAEPRLKRPVTAWSRKYSRTVFLQFHQESEKKLGLGWKKN